MIYLSIVQQIHPVKKDILVIIVNETSSALVPVTLPQGKFIKHRLRKLLVPPQARSILISELARECPLVFPSLKCPHYTSGIAPHMFWQACPSPLQLITLYPIGMCQELSSMHTESVPHLQARDLFINPLPGWYQRTEALVLELIPPWCLQIVNETSSDVSFCNSVLMVQGGTCPATPSD